MENNYKIKILLFLTAIVINCNPVKSESNSYDRIFLFVDNIKVNSRYFTENVAYTEYNLGDDYLDPWCFYTDRRERERIHIYFNQPELLKSIYLLNGFQGTSNSNEFSKIKKFEVFSDYSEINNIFELEDNNNKFWHTLKFKEKVKEVLISPTEYVPGYKYPNIACISEIALNVPSDFEVSLTKAEYENLVLSKPDDDSTKDLFDTFTLLYVSDSTQNYVFNLKLEGYANGKNKGKTDFETEFYPDLGYFWKISCSSWERKNNNIKVNCKIKEDFTPGVVDPGDPGHHYNKVLALKYIDLNLGNSRWAFTKNDKPAYKIKNEFVISEPILKRK